MRATPQQAFEPRGVMLTQAPAPSPTAGSEPPTENNWLDEGPPRTHLLCAHFHFMCSINIKDCGVNQGQSWHKVRI